MHRNTQKHTHKHAAYTCPLPTKSLYSMFTCIFGPAYKHIYTLKERERWSGAQIYVLVLSEWKLLFSSHVRCSANQAKASVMKWEEKHLCTATEEDTKAWPGTHIHALAHICIHKHTSAARTAPVLSFLQLIHMTPTLMNLSVYS